VGITALSKSATEPKDVIDVFGHKNLFPGGHCLSGKTLKEAYKCKSTKASFRFSFAISAGNVVFMR
jgi:hypothetical protein